MKKSLLFSVMVMSMAVLFVSGVMAQQNAAPAAASPAKSSAPESKLEKFSGVVEKVDPGTKEVVVEFKKEKMTFSAGDKTRIMEGKKEMPFIDVKVGMWASVGYKKEGDKLMAEMINFGPAKASHTAKKEPTSPMKSEEKAPEKK